MKILVGELHDQLLEGHTLPFVPGFNFGPSAIAKTLHGLRVKVGIVPIRAGWFFVALQIWHDAQGLFHPRAEVSEQVLWMCIALLSRKAQLFAFRQLAQALWIFNPRRVETFYQSFTRQAFGHALASSLNAVRSKMDRLTSYLPHAA
jgi:hypothetical protein